ncbi:MAG: TlpA disulfide reductase family protein [bacterium]
MKKYSLSVGLLVSLLVGMTLGAFAETCEPRIGSTPPLFELNNLDGKTIKLRDYLGEKPLIITFIASWSKPCQAILADLQALYPHANVLAISLDKKSKDLKSYLENNKLSFPVLVDKKLSLLDKYQILIIPSTFCVNSKGIIEKIFIDHDENTGKELGAWLN